jgi:uncharacterized membrane protein
VEALGILFVLGVIGSIVVVPIVAIVQALKAKRGVQQLREELTIVSLRLETAQRQARSLAERVQALEGARAAFPQDLQGVVPERLTKEPQAGAQSIRPSAHPREEAEPPEPAPPQGNQQEEAQQMRAPAPEPSAVSDEPTTEAAHVGDVNQPPARLDWEGVIGVRLFAWLGGGALFLAAALFLHYSIQQNLISPPVRVALGLVAGALLLAGGDRLRAKASLAGQALAGAGIGTLYAALYAARALYHLLPVTAAFAGMILVTLAAGTLAAKRSAYLIAVLGLIGGMATPFLLSTGEDHPWSLFGYVVLLDLGIAWVAKQREWPTLALLGLCASVLVFIAWSTRYLYPYRTPYALVALALVSALFVTLLWKWKPGEHSEVGATLRALAHLAIITPLLAAWALTHLPRVHANPTFLTGYLVVIVLGAAVIAQRARARAIPPLVAVLGVLDQAGCISSDLFDTQAVATLASFSMLPAMHLVIWWHQRHADWQDVHVRALVIVLASPLLLATTAVTLQPPSASVWPLAVYSALHASLLLLVAHSRAKPLVFALALGVVLIVSFVIGERAGEHVLGGLSAWLATSALVFWSLPLVSVRLRAGRIALSASGLALPLHFVLFYVLARDVWNAGPLGAICVLCGVLMLPGIRRMREVLGGRAEDQLALTALHGALCLGFLTAALPILLENQWLTVAFGLEVAALGWLHRRVAHWGLVFGAALLSVISVVRLLFNPYLWEYPVRPSLPILNLYLYTFGIVAVAFLLASHFLSEVQIARRWHLCTWLKWSSVILLFALVNVEIADFYSTGATLVFRFSGGGLAQDMTYSLAWGLFALALMIVGIVRHTRATRLGALVILILTIAKVFLHDLWQLGALYRVGSIVGLAVALLLVSYLVQRFILRGEQS